MRTREIAGCIAMLGACAAAAAADHEATITLSTEPGIGRLVAELGIGLGNFKAEGLDVRIIQVADYAPDDWTSTELLNNGTLTAEMGWFHRIVFGIGNGAPARAVMILEDSPHMTIFVANQQKDRIKGAADFKGRTIGDSEFFSTKHYLTDYMVRRAGLPADSYATLPYDEYKDIDVLSRDLREGRVDVVTTMEPMTSKLAATGLVTQLYDLTNAGGTRQALGDIWPTRCLYLAPSFIDAHPDVVQRLVNAVVRTMRFINSNSVDDVVANLPISYYNTEIDPDHWHAYKAARIDEIRKTMGAFARGDYSIPPTTAKLACDVLMKARFGAADDEALYRQKAVDSGKVRTEDTYDNRFVEEAMKDIK